jgi:hypothetical protein
VVTACCAVLFTVAYGPSHPDFSTLLAAERRMLFMVMSRNEAVGISRLQQVGYPGCHGRCSATSWLITSMGQIFQPMTSLHDQSTVRCAWLLCNSS